MGWMEWLGDIPFVEGCGVWVGVRIGIGYVEDDVEVFVGEGDFVDELLADVSFGVVVEV